MSGNAHGGNGQGGGGAADPMARTVVIPSPQNRTAPAPAAAAPTWRRTDAVSVGAVPKSGHSFDASAYPNPLVRAAGPLLVSAQQLKDTLTHPDPNAVRTRISQEIRAFDSNAKAFGVSIPQTNAARYVLCTFLDEIVMTTPWGAQSGWSGRSLLSEFYGETSGGVKVFTVMERALSEPGSYSQLLELCYIVLSLGYQGQYRIRDNGELKSLKERLYHAIRVQSPRREGDLSVNWRGEEQDRTAKLMHIVPLWAIALGGVLLLGAIYMLYALALNEVREPVFDLAQEIALEGEVLQPIVATDDAPAFDLEERLSPYVGNGLDVSVNGSGLAVITLNGEVDGVSLFQSGGVRIHRRAEPMLQRVAEVVDEFQTDITVDGHTDGQGRVQSNQALSEGRADTVRRELIFRGVSEELIETRGFGSNRPIIENEQTDSDRARNRRVELRFVIPAELMDSAP